MFFCCTSRLCLFLCRLWLRRLSPSLSPPVWLSNKAETFTYTSLYLAIPAAGCGGYTLALLPPPPLLLSRRTKAGFSVAKALLQLQLPGTAFADDREKKKPCAALPTQVYISRNKPKKIGTFFLSKWANPTPESVEEACKYALSRGRGAESGGEGGSAPRFPHRGRDGAPPLSRTNIKKKEVWLRSAPPLHLSAAAAPLLLGGERGKSCTVHCTGAPSHGRRRGTF